MLTYLQISLFESPAHALVNTVNTVGVMGKGIAAVFKQLYPEMYKEYQRLCREEKLKTGMLYIYRTPNKIIVNFPTKRHWRERSQVAYLEGGLEKFVARYMDYGITSVAFPQLGCGHGELNWERQVQPVMEHYLRDLPIPVYIHIYSPPPGFVPERFDVEFAQQMRVERQRISTNRLWSDLQQLVGMPDDQVYQLTLFGPEVKVNGEHIIFLPQPGDPVIVYREDIDGIWNTLRLRGTVGENDLPQSIRADGAGPWLFTLLSQLDYIQPIILRSRSEGPGVRGLRYDPRPEPEAQRVAEKVV
jgi:O-acetyl-ADP-ribose deacetylase (regulator of RNase III)